MHFHCAANETCSRLKGTMSCLFWSLLKRQLSVKGINFYYVSQFPFVTNQIILWVTANKYMGQGVQEWTKWNLWKTAFKKFEVCVKYGVALIFRPSERIGLVFVLILNSLILQISRHFVDSFFIFKLGNVKFYRYGLLHRFSSTFSRSWLKMN